MTEENLKDVKLIQDEYKLYFLTKGKEILQKIYDEKFNSMLAEYQKENADVVVENIIRYINDEHDRNLSVHLCNDISRFLRELSKMSYNLKSDIEEYAKEYIESWIKEKFNDRYKIYDYHSSEFEGLPWSLNINKEINIDFSKVYELAETEYNKWDDSNLSFIEYLKTMFIPVIIVGLSSFLILNLLFHKDLSKKIEVFDIEKSKITNKFIMITSLVHLGLVTVLLAISSYVNLEMWLISFVFDSEALGIGSRSTFPTETQRYNLNGQRVYGNYSGIIIQEGKKILNQ